eukprot:1139743-Pelagomonas_calceolata.AAC.9
MFRTVEEGREQAAGPSAEQLIHEPGAAQQSPSPILGQQGCPVAPNVQQQTCSQGASSGADEEGGQAQELERQPQQQQQQQQQGFGGGQGERKRPGSMAGGGCDDQDVPGGNEQAKDAAKQGELQAGQGRGTSEGREEQPPQGDEDQRPVRDAETRGPGGAEGGVAVHDSAPAAAAAAAIAGSSRSKQGRQREATVPEGSESGQGGKEGGEDTEEEEEEEEGEEEEEMPEGRQQHDAKARTQAAGAGAATAARDEAATKGFARGEQGA